MTAMLERPVEALVEPVLPVAPLAPIGDRPTTNWAIEQFREIIHEVAQEAAEENDYSEASMNPWLTALGVAPITRHECDTWRMTLSVTVRVSNTTDPDIAYRWAREALRSQDSDVEISDVDLYSDDIEADCDDVDCPNY